MPTITRNALLRMISKGFVATLLFGSVITVYAQFPITNPAASRAFDGLQLLKDPKYHDAVVTGKGLDVYTGKFNEIAKDVHRYATESDERGDLNLWALLQLSQVLTNDWLWHLQDNTKLEKMMVCTAILEVSIQKREFAGWTAPGVTPCLNLPSDASPDRVIAAALKATNDVAKEIKAEGAKKVP